MVMQSFQDVGRGVPMQSLRQLMRKKAYRTFFFSFILVFLLPVMVLLWVVGWSANAVRQESAASTRLTLEQLISGMDVQLSTAMRLTDSMLVDDKALYFAERDDPMRYLNNISSFQMLRNLTEEVGILPNTYGDIEQSYLYLPRSRKIISNTVNSMEDFYARKLSGLFESQEAWASFLHGQPTGFLLLGNVTYFAALRRGDALVLTACTTLKASVFERYRAMFADQPSQDIAVYAGHGGLLFQTASTPPELTSLVATASSGDQILETGEALLRVHWRQSPDTGCVYALYLPERAYQGPVRTLLIAMGLGVAALLFVGALLSLALARRQYRPILALRSFIDQNAQNARDIHGDDFEYLSAMIRALDAESRSAALEVRMTQGQLEQFALERLLKGMFTLSTDMEAQLLSLNIAFASDRFAVVGVRVNGLLSDVFKGAEELRAEDRQLIRFIISNVLEELLEGYDARSAAMDGQVWVLCALPEGNAWRDDVEAQLRKGLSFLEERFGFRMNLVCSDAVTGLDGIQAGYRAAVQWIRQADPETKSFRLQYRAEPSGTPTLEVTPSMSALAQHLARRISEGDEAGVEAWLADFGRQTLRLPPHLARLQWSALLQGVLAIVPVEGEAANLKLQRQIDALLSTPPLQDDGPAMLAVFRFLCALPRGQAGKGTDIAQKARAFIEENYADSGMNIAQIAEHLSLTPSYASALYKRQTGESMLDTINHVRLTHAKGLLLGGIQTAEEIALQVGYYSNSTFLRAFKKHEGVTPGQYRAMAGTAQA